MSFTIHDTDRTAVCVACGETYVVKAGHLPNHRCSEAFHARRQRAERRVDAMYSPTTQSLPPSLDYRRRTFRERFFDGVAMLQGGLA